LLSGIIISKFANTAIQYSSIHISTIFELKFIQSLKHRHSGMFLAGIQGLKTLDACLRRHDEIFRTTMRFRGNDAHVGQQKKKRRQIYFLTALSEKNYLPPFISMLRLLGIVAWYQPDNERDGCQGLLFFLAHLAAEHAKEAARCFSDFLADHYQRQLELISIFQR